VIDSGQIGEPLMPARAASVGENYTTGMAITDTLIHELDVLRWLLTTTMCPCKWCSAQDQQGPGPPARPADRAAGNRQGTRIDVEVFVNCQYGYDIQCEVVGETGIAKLPEPSQVQLRSGAKLSNAILMDWKDRFIGAYDVELQAFIDSVLAGQVGGRRRGTGLRRRWRRMRASKRRAVGRSSRSACLSAPISTADAISVGGACSR
jgi:myo-inositol 2-dehydrogenase/D-chiro-inositol 1-dehydrogenase